MKFGGTSVEDVAAFERLAGIVSTAYAQKRSSPVVVVSAMSGVTNALLASLEQSAAGDPEGAISSLKPHLERHQTVARKLAIEPAKFEATLDAAKHEIANLLKVTTDDNLHRPQLQDLVLSYGERLSAALLANVLRQANLPAQHVDARRCIITNKEHGRAEPLTPEITKRSRAKLEPLIDQEKIPVLEGFVGATVDGTTTTLGRGGSDYTAALIGAALNAKEVQIWTDVTGVLTADPRLVRQARTIPRLSYEEAAELAYFGAKVLHPKTIQPAMEQRIPVRICNARDPNAEGTVVCSDTELLPSSVKAIAHKTGITLVRVTSARMLGAYGFLHAIFEVFNRHRTVIDIVTTSEVSVSLSLDDTSTLAAIVDELNQFGAVRVEQNQAIICVVGEGLRTTSGIAGRIFNCLRDINVSLISHGASSVNVTFVVEEKNVPEAILRLHATFFEHDVAQIGEAAVA